MCPDAQADRAVSLRTLRRRLKPICDNAENLAGAGTDVRRCTDALVLVKPFIYVLESQIWGSQSIIVLL